MTEHPSRICSEFDCCECGRHIILICGDLPEPPLCAACQTVPGWLDRPEIRALIDPEGHARPADLATVPQWSPAS